MQIELYSVVLSAPYALKKQSQEQSFAILKNRFFFMSFLLVHMSAHHVDAWCPQSLEGAGITWD